MSRQPHFDQVANEVGVDQEERNILRRVWVKRLNSNESARYGDQHAHQKREAEIERDLGKLGPKGRGTFLLCIITRKDDALHPYHPEDDEEVIDDEPDS